MIKRPLAKSDARVCSTMSTFDHIMSRQLGSRRRPKSAVPLEPLHQSVWRSTLKPRMVSATNSFVPRYVCSLPEGHVTAFRFQPSGQKRVNGRLGTLAAVTQSSGELELPGTVSLQLVGRDSLDGPALWSRQTGGNLRFDIRPNSVLTWCHDEQSLLYGTEYGTIVQVDIKGEADFVFEGDKAANSGVWGGVRSVEQHRRDPTRFLASYKNGVVALWDNRCRPKRSSVSQCMTRPHSRRFGRSRKSAVGLSSAMFDGDHRILTAGNDGIVKLWDARRLRGDGEIVLTAKQAGASRAAGLRALERNPECPECKLAAFTDGTICLFGPQTSPVKLEAPDPTEVGGSFDPQTPMVRPEPSCSTPHFTPGASPRHACLSSVPSISHLPIIICSVRPPYVDVCRRRLGISRSQRFTISLGRRHGDSYLRGLKS